MIKFHPWDVIQRVRLKKRWIVWLFGSLPETKFAWAYQLSRVLLWLCLIGLCICTIIDILPQSFHSGQFWNSIIVIIALCLILFFMVLLYFMRLIETRYSLVHIPRRRQVTEKDVPRWVSKHIKHEMERCQEIHKVQIDRVVLDFPALGSMPADRKAVWPNIPFMELVELIPVFFEEKMRNIEPSLRRPRSATFREYIELLTSRNYLSPNYSLEIDEFLNKYEFARFSGVPITRAQIVDLMTLFSKVIVWLAEDVQSAWDYPAVPHALYGLDASALDFNEIQLPNASLVEAGESNGEGSSDGIHYVRTADDGSLQAETTEYSGSYDVSDAKSSTLGSDGSSKDQGSVLLHRPSSRQGPRSVESDAGDQSEPRPRRRNWMRKVRSNISFQSSWSTKSRRSASAPKTKKKNAWSLRLRRSPFRKLYSKEAPPSHDSDAGSSADVGSVIIHPLDSGIETNGDAGQPSMSERHVGHTGSASTQPRQEGVNMGGGSDALLSERWTATLAGRSENAPWRTALDAHNGDSNGGASHRSSVDLGSIIIHHVSSSGSSN